MLDLIWTRTKFLDISKFGAGVAMLATPWLLELGPAAKWDLWICGYAVATVCVADLTAEADWEPKTSLWLGIWLAAAPWMLGFSDHATATFLHLVAGTIVSLLSAAELWSVDHTPPRRFRPGATRHAEVVGSINDGKADEVVGPAMIVRDRFVPLPRANFLGRRKRPPRFSPLGGARESRRSLCLRREACHGSALHRRSRPLLTKRHCFHA
jgi:SPW repeat